MSESSKHAFASKMSHHSASSILNAEAAMFMPRYTPALFPPVQRSALRASAPTFVARGAHQTTPHRVVENNKVVNAASLDGHPHGTTSGFSWNATQCFDAPFDFSISNGIGFDTSSINTSGLSTTDLDTTSELDITSDFNSSALDTILGPEFASLGNNPVHYPSSIDSSDFDTTSSFHTISGFHNVSGLDATRRNNTTRRIDKTFGHYSSGLETSSRSIYNPDAYGHGGSKHTPMNLSPSGQSSTESCMNFADDNTPIYESELDGEGETDDEYEPTVSPASDGITSHYPTPSSEDTNPEQTNVDKRQKSATAAKPVGIQKNRSSRPAIRKTRAKKSNTGATDSGGSIDDAGDVTWAARKKMANAIVSKQKKSDSLEEKLGHDVHIDRTGGRVNFDGVYWYAPKDDHSIPRGDQAKRACIQEVVAAMRNYDNIKDSKTAGVKNRWGPGASYYTREELYACAGDIVVSLIACVRISFANDHRRTSWSMFIPTAGRRRLTTLNCVRHGSRP